MLNSLTPYIVLHDDCFMLLKGGFFSDKHWFNARIKLVLQKPNNLYLLINHYKEGRNGRDDEYNEAVDLGTADKSRFKEIQDMINKKLRGKLRKLKFSIEKINDNNKKDDNYYVHGCVQGNHYMYGNVVYQHRQSFHNLEDVLKDEKEYDEYEYFYSKKYIS